MATCDVSNGGRDFGARTCACLLPLLVVVLITRNITHPLGRCFANKTLQT